MPKVRDIRTLPMDNSHDSNQNGIWQMWNSSLPGQDGLGLLGSGPASWVLPPELNRLNKDEVVLPLARNNTASLFLADNQAFSHTHSPMKVFPGSGHDGNFAFIPGSTGDPWLPTTLFAHIPGTDGGFYSNHLEDNCQNEKMNGSPSSSASNHSFDFSPASGCAKISNEDTFAGLWDPTWFVLDHKYVQMLYIPKFLEEVKNKLDYLGMNCKAYSKE